MTMGKIRGDVGRGKLEPNRRRVSMSADCEVGDVRQTVGNLSLSDRNDNAVVLDTRPLSLRRRRL